MIVSGDFLCINMLFVFKALFLVVVISLAWIFGYMHASGYPVDRYEDHVIKSGQDDDE
jgi:hypothetical protein